MQPVSESYKNAPVTVEPGWPLHRLVALLADTHYDDVTEERIDDLVARVETWRWMNAAGERVDI